MELSRTRRGFLAAATGLATVTWIAPWRTAVAFQRTPQPLPSPNAPKNQNVPGGLDTHPTDNPVKAPASTVNATEINALVQQLYQLTAELKQETDRTNLNNTLPADFIKRAQQIEKLARNIRDKARG